MSGTELARGRDRTSHGRRLLAPLLAVTAIVTFVVVNTKGLSATSPFDEVSLYRDVTYQPDMSGLDREDQRLVARMLEQPQGVWLGEWIPAPADYVESVLDDATAVGQVPLFVVYGIPDRDCGGFSTGGMSDHEEYRQWIRDLASALADARAFVVLEPDALAQLDCLASDRARQERLLSLRSATEALGRLPGVTTYLDGGHAGWIEPVEMSRHLADAGVAEIRGFSLNVSYYNRTDVETEYGLQISDRLGGAPFVIDTSRNGAGPWSGEPSWCNPPGRALGDVPLSRPPHGRVDALLWVKRPGISDGPCGRREPAAGEFWPEYAVALTKRAGW
ncbi:MAG: glycoside hydrolase family 6 protein [Kineosporiaceae bacterium]